MLRKIHFYLAISAGTVFVLLGLSGAGLVFRGDLVREAAPRMPADYLDREELDADVLVARLKAVYPELELRSIALPREPRDYFRVSIRYPRDGKTVSEQLFLDPLSGASHPVKQMNSALERSLYKFHTSLFAGEAGTVLVGFSGVILLGLMGSGFVLSVSGRGRIRGLFKYSMAARGRMHLAMLHRLAAVYGLPVLLLIAVSGAALVFRGAMIDPLSAPMPELRPVAVLSSGSCRGAPRIEDYITAAEEALPEGTAGLIRFPRRENRPLVVVMRQPGEVPSPLGLSEVRFKPGCAVVTGVLDGNELSIAQAVTEWVVALHNGQVFGAAGRPLYVLAGLLPVFLLVSGWKVRLNGRGVKKRAKPGADRRGA